MEGKIRSQMMVVTHILLVLLGSTIFQSCQPISTCITIHDIQVDATDFLASVASQDQNVTHEGDLLINNSKTFAIEDTEFYMKGKITVKDNSTLIIRNSKFTTIPSWDGESIVLENQANLIIANATVIFEHPGDFDCKILVQDDAEVNITYSTLQNWGYIVSHNNSVVHVNNSTIAIGTVHHGHYSGVALYDTSTAEIKNSTMDGVFVWNNSTASIKCSMVALIRIGWKNSAKATVDIANSEIEAIEALSGALHVGGSAVTGCVILNYSPSACFTGSSVEELSASGDANILLIDSFAGSIKTHGNATVFVGWNLPLFGLVTVHYTWIPIVQITIATAFIVIAITMLVFLLRKRTKWGQRKKTASEVSL